MLIKEEFQGAETSIKKKRGIFRENRRMQFTCVNGQISSTGKVLVIREILNTKHETSISNIKPAKNLK